MKTLSKLEGQKWTLVIFVFDRGFKIDMILKAEDSSI
jgi:hypothetical protein